MIPRGWLPIALSNPEGSEYLLHQLGDALKSRFIHVHVKACVKTWMEYAKGINVHPDVLAYAEHDKSIFDGVVQSNPRAWVGVSKILFAAEKLRTPKKILRAMVEGKVGPARASAFFSFLRGGNSTALEPNEILTQYPKHRRAVSKWVTERIDLVEASLANLKMHFQLSRNVAALKRSKRKQANLEFFLQDIPGDFKDVMAAVLESNGFSF